MVYHVKSKEDEKGYYKVVGFESISESPEDLCDIGTEALFIDTKDHTNISLRMSASACSDFKQLEDGSLEIYMSFKDEIPTEVNSAFENGELFVSEC